MTKLSNAPLLEAIFELRWRHPPIDPSQEEVTIKFSVAEKEFFFGQFRGVADAYGFANSEPVHESVQGLFPHLVKHRFRRSTNRWPCYQIGLGIFTVNQINDGYSWESFKQYITTGLELLDKGHPEGLKQLGPYEVLLRYRDGYPIETGTKIFDQLKTVFNIKLETIRDKFLENEQFDSEVVNVGLSFEINLTQIPGSLIFKVQSGLINGKNSIITDTIVRYYSKNKEIGSNEVLYWAQGAHGIQKYAFNNLLDPAFKKGL